MTQTTEKTKYNNEVTTTQRVRKITGKDGRRWIVVETIHSRIYSESFFEAVLRRPETVEELEALAAPLLEA